jgi:hypothetical protein
LLFGELGPTESTTERYVCAGAADLWLRFRICWGGLFAASALKTLQNKKGTRFPGAFFISSFG